MPGSAEGKAPITDDLDSSQVDERVKDIRKHQSQYWRAFR
jgi:hypothetical protein